MENLDEILKEFKTPPDQQGWWISFEGIEGCGKSTQIKILENLLIEKGFEVLTVREPGGTELGEELRKVILEHKKDLSPLGEVFIFLASRSELLVQKILPWLNSKKRIILMDRYIDSSLVYQGWAKTKSFNDVLKLHQFSPLNNLPHYTFVLEITPELSLERQAKRNHKKDYFESRGINFLNDISIGYKKLKEIFPQRVHVIDGAQEIELIKKDILAKLSFI